MFDSYPETHIVQNHILRVLDSYRHFAGRDLVCISGNPDELVDEIINASYVLLSCGPEPDPILNFANKQALKLWEWEWDEMVRTPARLTAEADERPARKKLLEGVQNKGYADNYEGVRISSSGKRFLIRNASVWNVIGSDGTYLGQAAYFNEWKFL